MRGHTVMAIGVVALLGGCFNPHAVLKRRVSLEHSCPEDEVWVQDLGGHAYRVTACGHRATYVCRNRACAQETDTVEVATGPDPENVAQYALDTVRNQLWECIGRPETIPIEFDTEGRVSELGEWPGESGTERGCVAATLVDVQLSPPPSMPMDVEYSLTGGSHGGSLSHAQEDAAPAPVPSAERMEGTGAAAEPHMDGDAEPVIREYLDANAPDILACTDTERAPVRVQYGPAGDITVTLQGELAGTEKEACVRALLDGFQAPASPGGGAVLHVVRSPG